MRPLLFLSFVGAALVNGHLTRAEEPAATPLPTPAFVLTPGKVLNPKPGECRDLSRDEELFTVDITRGEHPVSTVYRQRLAAPNREMSLKVPGIISWLQVSATGRYLAFGTEAKETFLAAPFGGDGDWRTWKLAAAPWSSACFSLGEDYLMGCPETRDHFEGVSLAAAPTDAAPEVKSFPVVDLGYKFDKQPVLIPLPEHRFLVDAAGLILHEDGATDKAPALGSEVPYDFLVGPTAQGWVIHVKHRFAFEAANLFPPMWNIPSLTNPPAPNLVTPIEDTQLLIHPLNGQILPLAWAVKKRIEQAWIGRDNTIWMQFYDAGEINAPWLHQYRIEPTGKPSPRKKKK